MLTRLAFLKLTSFALAKPNLLVEAFVPRERSFRLFEPIASAGKMPVPEGADYVAPIRMRFDMLGLPQFEIGIPGETDLCTARFVDSVRRSDGETFFYASDESSSELSVFTTFYDRPSYARVKINGRTYLIHAQDDDHRLVHRLVRANECLGAIPAETMSMPVNDASGLKVEANRRRSAGCGCEGPYLKIPIIVAVGDEYLAAVGSEQRVRDRVTMMIDNTHAALRGSGAPHISFVVREVAFIQIPNVTSVFDWAIDAANPVVRDIRRRNKAAVSLVLNQVGVGRAPINALDDSFPVYPDFNVATAGGYYDDSDDGDLRVTTHELGHVLGGNHNKEAKGDAAPPVNETWPFRRDWTECNGAVFGASDGVYGALAYNTCDTWLENINLFSGLGSFYKGRRTGIPDVRDNVRAFKMAAPRFAKDFV